MIFVPSLEKKEFSSSFNAYFNVPFSTLAGAAFKGAYGATTGLISSIADEALKNLGYNNNHHLTRGSFWSAAAYPFFSFMSDTFELEASTPLLGVMSLTYGITMSYFTPDCLNFEERLKPAVDSLKHLTTLFDTDQIFTKERWNKNYELLFSSPFEGLKTILNDVCRGLQNEYFSKASMSLGLTLAQGFFETGLFYLMGNYLQDNFIPQFILDCPGLLKSNPEAAMRIGIKLTILFSLTLMTYLVRLGLNLGHQSTLMKIYTISSIRGTTFLLENENGRKILATEKGQSKMQTLPQNIQRFIFDGMDVFNNELSKMQTALIGLGSIASYCPASLLPVGFTLLSLSSIFDHMGKQARYYYNQLSEIEQDVWTRKYDLQFNADAVALRGGSSYFEKVISEMFSIAQSYRVSQQTWMQIETTTDNFKDLVIRLLNSALVLISHSKKLIELKHISTLWNSVEKLTQFLYSPLKKQFDQKELLKAIEDFDDIYKILSQPNESNITKSIHSEPTIKISNYSLELNGDVLLEIPSLSLEKGKSYAITGASGCGKSSFLKDLKIGLMKPFKSCGQFSFYKVDGKPAKIDFLDQDLYLPNQCTLFEAINFPTPLSCLSTKELEYRRELTLSLFDQLAINDENTELESSLKSKLDSKEFQLSGGQKKKVGFIQAIFSHPDILIMDEAFTGLDPYSLTLSQKALKEYLPSTTFIVVDHDAREEKHLSFYDKELHFSSGRVEMKAFE